MKNLAMFSSDKRSPSNYLGKPLISRPKVKYFKIVILLIVKIYSSRMQDKQRQAKNVCKLSRHGDVCNFKAGDIRQHNQCNCCHTLKCPDYKHISCYYFFQKIQTKMLK